MDPTMQQIQKCSDNIPTNSNKEKASALKIYPDTQQNQNVQEMETRIQTNNKLFKQYTGKTKHNQMFTWSLHKACYPTFKQNFE